MMKPLKYIKCPDRMIMGCEKWFRTEKDMIEHCRVKHPEIYDEIKTRKDKSTEEDLR